MYRLKWYKKNREKVNASNSERRKEMKMWLAELKTGLKCSTCGESHPSCLQFHHNDPAQKELSVTDAVSYGWGKNRILLEMKKCTVLCSNCHFKVHWNERLS